jgi:RNA recognition motif-containing protein
MRIFVGNLAFTTTEDELRQRFEPYGIVERVQIMTDREIGRPRGFGFVEMPDASAARAAIAGLQGTPLGGRTLSVNEARPREERRPRW